MNNNIGEARRTYSAAHGKFTQQDAAKVFGVALSTYRGWEQGVGKGLNGEQLCKLADFYDTSVDYLLCRTNNPRFSQTRYPGRYEMELMDLVDKMDSRHRDTLIDTARAFSALSEKDKPSYKRYSAVITMDAVK